MYVKQNFYHLSLLRKFNFQNIRRERKVNTISNTITKTINTTYNVSNQRKTDKVLKTQNKSDQNESRNKWSIIFHIKERAVLTQYHANSKKDRIRHHIFTIIWATEEKKEVIGLKKSNKLLHNGLNQLIKSSHILFS